MTILQPLLLALDRIATALEQLAPALTQATREAHSGRLRWTGPLGPSKEDDLGSVRLHGSFDASNEFTDAKRGRHERIDFDRPSIPFWSPTSEPSHEDLGHKDCPFCESAKTDI